MAAATELGSGTRLEKEWAQIAAAGDAATEAYLTATTEFPLDGTRPVSGARAADERAQAEIERARESIRRFRSRHSRVLNDAALARLSVTAGVRHAGWRRRRRSPASPSISTCPRTPRS